MVDYHVDTPDGPVGVLEEWRLGADGKPVGIVVAQGWFGRRRVEVPLALVDDVDPESGRVLLARGAAPLEQPARSRARLGPLRRLLGRLRRDRAVGARA
jgi:hypothetical protein